MRLSPRPRTERLRTAGPGAQAPKFRLPALPAWGLPWIRQGLLSASSGGFEGSCGFRWDVSGVPFRLVAHLESP